MKKASRSASLLLLFFLSGVLFASFDVKKTNPSNDFTFPYKEAGLTTKQAAAHLLSRFSFGATPGQVNTVVDLGLEEWFRQQLEGKLHDDSLNTLLKGYGALQMKNEQIVQTYPRGGQLLRMAIRDGYINKDSFNTAGKKDYKQELKEYMQQRGYKPPADLMRQIVGQKILRASYSKNQLHELLTDFWFNHFNVSLTKNDCAPFVLAYERDAIRPNVTGSFESLLLATAKSPAMLTYLDNFRSVAAASDPSPAKEEARRKLMKRMEGRSMDTTVQKQDMAEKIKKARKAQGLNENYAREIMELHTLGVDGGYSQNDVTEAARVLTGWTIYPMERYKTPMEQLEKNNQSALKRAGFVHEGDFLFAANKHDKGEKKVLGVHFPAGGGYEEGTKLISMLAHHPSTARFISTKLAVRFVTDHPPASLVDKMTKTFKESGGDISKVLTTMATSPEFWDKKIVREKTKSPFELAISAVRSLNAEVKMPYQLFTWITKMGEKMYFYQAPTGFPDRGDYWINTGSLLNRMNFGLALSAQRIPGIQFDLSSLNQNREPESAEAALTTYTKLLLPERDIEGTIKRLTPLLNDPEISRKVDAAASRAPSKESMAMLDAELIPDDGAEKAGQGALKKGNNKKPVSTFQMQASTGNNSMLAQVVGIIIGSPEFQRK